MKRTRKQKRTIAVSDSRPTGGKARKGNALLWVMATSVIVGAASLYMLEMTRNISNRTVTQVDKVRYYYAVEEEAERFRAHLILAFTGPQATNRVDAKTFLRSVRVEYMGDHAQYGSDTQTSADDDPYWNSDTVTSNPAYSILSTENLKFVPRYDYVDIQVTATSNPNMAYGNGQTPWIEFVARGPGKMVNGEWKFLSELPGGKRVGRQIIKARIAFGQNKKIEGIPTVTRHAMLAENVSCMFCHLDVTGTVGTFEKFLPGFDDDGSGNSSTIRGSVFMTYNTSSNNQRNIWTTFSDGTSKLSYFPFTGVDYNASDKYNPHWKTNIEPRTQLEGADSLSLYPQVINGAPVTPTGREDPNSITLVYDNYRNEGATFRVNKKDGKYRVQYYFPDSATGNQYAYKWAEETGYDTESEATSRGTAVVNSVPKNMLPEDKDNDGSPDFPTLKSTLMRQWASGKILFKNGTAGPDGIMGTADDQLTIVHRKTYDGGAGDYVGFYHKATNPNDPDFSSNNETAAQTGTQTTTLVRGVEGDGGAITLTQETIEGVGFASIPNFTDPMKSQSVEGNVILVGTPDNPVIIEGNVFVDGDLIIKGYVTGRGTIYASRNVYVAGDIYTLNPPEPYDPYDPRWGGDYDTKKQGNPSLWAQQQLEMNRDEFRLAARNSAIVGDYTHYDYEHFNYKYAKSSFTPDKIEESNGQYNTSSLSMWDYSAYNFLKANDNLGKSLTDRISTKGVQLDKSGKIWEPGDPYTFHYEYTNDLGDTLDRSDDFVYLRDYWVDLYDYWRYTDPSHERGNRYRYDEGIDVTVDPSYIGTSSANKYYIPYSQHKIYYNNCKTLAKSYKYNVVRVVHHAARAGYWQTYYTYEGGGYGGGTRVKHKRWIPPRAAWDEYIDRWYTPPVRYHNYKVNLGGATYDNTFMLYDPNETSWSRRYNLGQRGANPKYDAHIAPTYVYPAPDNPKHGWTVAWISDADYRKILGVHEAVVPVETYQGNENGSSSATYTKDRTDNVLVRVDDSNTNEQPAPLAYVQPGIKDYAVRLQSRYADDYWRLNQEFDTEWDAGVDTDHWRSSSYTTAKDFKNTVWNEWYTKSSNQSDREGHQGDARDGIDFTRNYPPQYTDWNDAKAHGYDFWPKNYKNDNPNQSEDYESGWRAVFDRNGDDKYQVEAFLADLGVYKHWEINVNGRGADNSYVDFINSAPAVYNIPNRMNALNEKAVKLGWPDKNHDRKPDLRDLDGDGKILAEIVDPSNDNQVTYRYLTIDPNTGAQTWGDVLVSGVKGSDKVVNALVANHVGAVEAFDIRTKIDVKLGHNDPILSPFDYKDGYAPALKQVQNVDAFIYANRAVGAVSTSGNTNLRIYGGLAGRYVAILNDASYNTMYRSSFIGQIPGMRHDLLKYWRYQDENYYENLSEKGGKTNIAHNFIRWVSDGNGGYMKIHSGNAISKDNTKMVLEYDFRLTEKGHQGVDGLGDQLIAVPLGWTLYWIRMYH